MRHNRIQPLLQNGCVALRMRFFPQNFGTIKRILPGSSSPSHREGPGTEVGSHGVRTKVGRLRKHSVLKSDWLSVKLVTLTCRKNK